MSIPRPLSSTISLHKNYTKLEKQNKQKPPKNKNECQ